MYLPISLIIPHKKKQNLKEVEQLKMRYRESQAEEEELNLLFGMLLLILITKIWDTLLMCLNLGTCERKHSGKYFHIFFFTCKNRELCWICYLDNFPDYWIFNLLIRS